MQPSNLKLLSLQNCELTKPLLKINYPVSCILLYQQKMGHDTNFFNCKGSAFLSVSSFTSFLIFALVIWGCYNKVPQSRSPKTMEIYSLSQFLGARSLKSRYWQDYFPSMSSRKKFFLALSKICSPKNSLDCSTITAISASIFLSCLLCLNFPLFIRIPTVLD